MKKNHSKYPPSSAYRWLNCPASVLLPKDEIERDTTAADEGSLAHKLCELTLTSDDWDDNEEEISEARLDPLYDPAMDDYVDQYVDYIESKNVKRSFIEKRLDLSHYMKGLFGTCDCILMDGDFKRLYVIDFKYGRKKVEVKDNPQLLFYALGASDLFLENYPDAGDFAIEMTIFQPRINNIATQTISYSDLKKWYRSKKPAIDKILDGTVERVTGDWCDWCDRKVHCGAYADKLIDSVEIVDFFVLSDDEIASNLLKLREFKEKADKYEKDLSKYLTRRIKEGNHVNGLKLLRGRKSRSWDKADIVAKTASGLDLDVFEVISPAKLEKRIGKKAFKDNFEALVKYTEGAPILAKADDKREEFKA